MRNDTDDQTEGQRPEDLVTLKEAARTTGAEQSTIYYWVRAGVLDSWRRGLGKGQLLVSRAAVTRLLEEQRRIRPVQQA